MHTFTPFLTQCPPTLTMTITGYWEDTANQRRFFDDLAAELKFDPLVAENWLQLKAQDVLNKVVCSLSFLARYLPGIHLLL